MSVPRRRPQPLTRTAAGHAIALFATDATQAARWTPKTTTDGRPDGPRRAPKNQPEREDVVKPILALLATAGVWRRRVYTGGIPLPGGHLAANPLRGIGDILALLPRVRDFPIPWSIECKFSTGAQRRSQEEFEESWVAAGGLYTLARSVADVRAVLEEYRR